MNTEIFSKFRSLASLLKYPGDEFQKNLNDAAETFSRENSDGDEHFSSFQNSIRDQSIEQMEELYTRTFDLNPVCTLEVGWQLYGEEYKRGEFLVRMRRLLRKYGIAEGTELPDHLAYLLLALDRIETEPGKELADKFIRPALKKMIEGFKDKSNPYFSLLRFLDAELARYVDIERKAEL
ncbi:MAG: molecular chaperone TorD family protein [bacterium]|jgi:nitrate reductase delta subunit